MTTTTLLGWANIQYGNGITLMVMGMLITFTTLAIIALAIAAIPHLLKLINRFIPEHDHHGGEVALESQAPAETPAPIAEPLSEAQIAAIAFAAYHFQQRK